jgi:hypothetical protein
MGLDSLNGSGLDPAPALSNLNSPPPPASVAGDAVHGGRARGYPELRLDVTNSMVPSVSAAVARMSPARLI